MGKHRTREEMLAEKLAWMREAQRRKRERAPERTARPKTAPAAPADEGFTWGTPLPRRSRLSIQRTQEWRRRKKRIGIE